MRDDHIRVWPNAAKELSAIHATKGMVKLWYRDNELDFTIKSVVTTNRNPEGPGHRIELINQKVTAVIHTRDESDEIELSFYSKG